jgi:hypothetical protein
MIEKMLFLSHAEVDRDLAALLEETVYLSVPGTQVFRASRVGQIAGGREWFDVVTHHLKESALYVILLSGNSVEKPWLSFETGAAWYTQRPLKPVLAPGFTPREVPEPLRFLQLLSLSDTGEAAQLFTELGGKLQDPETFVSRAVELASNDRSPSMREQGWAGIEFGEDFFALDGPLEKLPEGDPVQMPDDLPEAFKSAGYDLVFGTSGRLTDQISQGFKRIWRIVGWKRKHSLIDRVNKQQLCARAKTAKGG